MKKFLSIIVIFLLLSVFMAEPDFANKKASGGYCSSSLNSINQDNHPNELSQLPTLFSNYVTGSEQKKIKSIQLPWINKQSDILEWWIKIKYNGEIFEKQVPVDISDFKEKFLKHPEYGERISFNLDEDDAYDLEVIAGFYWSIIKNEDGNDVKSLEKRIRVRQLESGNYIEDQDGEMQVWSELHVNYGLIKKEIHRLSVVNKLHETLQKFTYSSMKIQQLLDQLNIFEQFISYFPSGLGAIFSEDDSDYFVVGMGFKSPLGQDIPRFAEKRFSFARDTLFGPSIFQHEMDPGSSKGKGPFEVLYGFSAFQEGSTNPTYDIAFSVEFDPAVSLKTKFIPSGGLIYYYFDESSQQRDETMISFTSNVLSGDDGDIELTLIFDKIDETLGKVGRWMKFDADVLGDHELLGGKIAYEASHIFDVGIIVNSPLFEEKIELIHIPKIVDVSWDLDFSLMTNPLFHAHVDGFVDVSMSSPLGGINVFFPKLDETVTDQIFIDVPQGLPENMRIDAEATLNLDLDDLQNPANYVYGDIQHTCSDNVACIRAFLPAQIKPIINVTEIPAESEAKGKLNWNKLEGYVELWRGSHGPADPIELNIGYKGFSIHDVLAIRNGHINTQFKLAEDGHFFFDTTESIFGNELNVVNMDTGDSLSLFVNEISADNLQADWNIDTSGDSLKINDLHLGGMVDVMNDLQLDLCYLGKSTSLHMDWYIGQSGSFQIQIDQENDLSIDFNDFAMNNTDFDFGGKITLSETIIFDMSWDLEQGSGSQDGSVDPGFFAINKYNDGATIKEFIFYLTYEELYGIDIKFSNLQFYLNLEWWKGDRLLPYVWLDYEVSTDDFDVDLLWTNQEGETQWYENVEEW
ncbi:MAG: hypothetical protein KGY65_00015 [Candidatus Thermoplasmatota archaeon]|nr:hypothetical protein [Candidatus Thermoplasmatota archaeon]MBS3801120.1 hypothetical protein [Candidatus Thermoplasmatota archaeon]